MSEITTHMSELRKGNNLPYRELPYNTKVADRINEIVKDYEGRYDNLVVLGIGGSALGNIALQTALNPPMYNHTHKPRLWVMDNVDPVQFGTLLEYLDGQLDRTLFNVISKSGRTAETAAQYLTVAEMLDHRGLSLEEHIIATTDLERGILKKFADELKLQTLVVPNGVGGRFSVLSDVGLFSAAMCGIDIHELLKGARAMDKRVSKWEIMENPAAIYAAVQHLAYKQGRKMSVMMPYSYQLKDLCDWYRQLWAESLGKRVDLDGRDVFVGPTPIKALGTTDQHSQVQLYREGPDDKIFTFLYVKNFDMDFRIGETTIKDLRYLSGKNMSKLMNDEKLATEYALLASERPCMTVEFPRITPYSVGQFIYMFEVATSFMGALLNINPYDQPAVDLGKYVTLTLMGKRDKDRPEFRKDIKKTLAVNSNYRA